MSNDNDADNLELAENVLNLPYDFSKSFTKSTAELLSNMMYKKPELRPKIALALQRLVEKYKTLLDSTHDDAELKKLYKLDRATITKNLEVLQKYSPNFLAVFFNVFSETLPLYRGYMLNVIKAYLEITPLKDLNVFFNKALDLLKQSLETMETTSSNNKNNNYKNNPNVLPPMSYTMLDLLIAMVQYLDVNSTKQLYDMAVTTLIFKDDGTLQKKGYKLLKQITESENNKSMILENIEDLQNKLSSTVMTTATPVKNVRLLTFINIIKILPESDLHMIPDILSETILCTKEPREKTRSAAYELLVVMGNKMKNGGTVVISKVSEADPNSADVEANINEFVFSMVVAGLAATTPHMISATITSISRLIFEFKKDLDIDLIHQLLYTMDNFVNCKSREIVKSALGFFKVATISLDVDILTPHLSQIIIGLLVWSNEHKNRFKVKVRHILERMIRRFGYDIIEKHVPESDKKLIVNIKKRRERAKRKMKAKNNTTAINNNKATKKRVVYDSAYDEALYGSESDLEDSDDHDNNSDVSDDKSNKKNKKKKNKKFTSSSWIKEDPNAPIDFLDSSMVSNVVNVDPQKINKKKSLSSTFKETSEGKLIIESDADDDDSDADDDLAKVYSSIQKAAENHYLESKNSSVAFTLGLKQKLKYTNKNSNDMDIDSYINNTSTNNKKHIKKSNEIEPIDAVASRMAKKQKKKEFIPIGKEYKAKKAGGDIKKSGKPDPYAYVPLSSMYHKKGQQKVKISLISKGKVSKRQTKIRKKY